jgi:elongation of very long chain fatty acids protein 6
MATMEGAIKNNQYNDTFLFFFERKFNYAELAMVEAQWMILNWTWSFYYSFIYIGLIFIGQRVMKNREKVHLYRSLVAWNILHSVFSVLGTFRLLPIFIRMLTQKGIDYSICEAEYDFGPIGAWSTLFVTVKVFDLIDTLFVILRKQKLIFLHWYHHASSLIYCWYCFHELSSTGRWFSMMNITAHALMYPYYTFRVLRYNIPVFVMITITSLQTFQMVIGIYVNTYALLKKNKGGFCRVSYENIYWSFFMYFTFFILFSNFFVNRYLRKPARKDSGTNKNKIDNYYEKASYLSNYISGTVGRLFGKKDLRKKKTF